MVLGSLNAETDSLLVQTQDPLVMLQSARENGTGKTGALQPVKGIRILWQITTMLNLPQNGCGQIPILTLPGESTGLHPFPLSGPTSSKEQRELPLNGLKGWKERKEWREWKGLK